MDKYVVSLNYDPFNYTFEFGNFTTAMAFVELALASVVPHGMENMGELKVLIEKVPADESEQTPGK